MNIQKATFLFGGFLLLNSHFLQAANTFDCHREAEEGTLPFIRTTQTSLTLTVENKGPQYQGVHFSHAPHKPSPHVTHTHAESAYHVYGGQKWGDAEKIATVLEQNPHFAGPLDALCLEVKPTPLPVVKEGTIWKMGDEHYVSGESLEPNPIEAVITKASLKELVETIPTLKPVQMVSIKVPGGESCMENWPYLTNEAVSYVMGLGPVGIIALNLPSIDRENDEGATSNHKLLFSSPHRLVLEMADFRPLLTKTYYKMNLHLQPTAFEDCAVSHLTAEEETL